MDYMVSQTKGTVTSTVVTWPLLCRLAQREVQPLGGSGCGGSAHPLAHPVSADVRALGHALVGVGRLLGLHRSSLRAGETCQ